MEAKTYKIEKKNIMERFLKDYSPALLTLWTYPRINQKVKTMKHATGVFISDVDQPTNLRISYTDAMT